MKAFERQIQILAQSAQQGGGHDGEQGSDGNDSGVAVQEGRPKLKEPPQYAVVLHNDDYTTMEFVIEVLKKFFRKTQDESMEITLKVHHEGRGVAGIYSREIAETKVAQGSEYSRVNEHPLRCTAEPVA